MNSLKVSAIFRYPVKSLAGQSYQTLTVDSRGFLHDRRWMLIDAQGNKLTQREDARLAFLQAEVLDQTLRITDRRDQTFTEVPLNASGTGIVVDVWGTSCETELVSPEADVWLSTRLEQPVRLVHQPDVAMRKIDPRYASEGEKVSLADGYPFLLANENS
ncbi:MAG: MOSC N-terminal beta barrel domain-containing protein, partial [Bacteroidota bacterium]